MKRWTLEAKARQAVIIHQWQPWKKAGVKTPEGKAISKMNAYKHCGYDREAQMLRKTITQCKAFLRQVVEDDEVI